MACLAGKVDKNLSQAQREYIIISGGSANYIKRRMDQGRQGHGLTCLVVADNVWEPEVIGELSKTGM